MPSSRCPCRWVRSWLSWSASGVSGPPPDPRNMISRTRWPVSLSASTAPRTPRTPADDFPVPVRSASSSTASCLAIPACSPSSSVAAASGASWHWLAEDLADHHRELPRPAQQIGSSRRRCPGRRRSPPSAVPAPGRCRAPARSASCGQRRRAARLARPQDRQPQMARQQVSQLTGSRGSLDSTATNTAGKAIKVGTPGGPGPGWRPARW